MDQHYVFDDLDLRYTHELLHRSSIVELEGDEDAYCNLFNAQAEKLASPIVIYNGSYPLYPTNPNFFAETNPGLLFPVINPGHVISVASLHNAICIDGGIIITQSSHLYAESFRHLTRLQDRVGLDMQTNNRFRLTKFPKHFRYVHGKSLFLDGEHFAAYGHFVGEILTRLWFTKLVDLADFTIICGKVMAPHLLALLEPFGITKEQIIFNEGALICKQLFVPNQSFVVRQSMTAMARLTWDIIGNYHDQQIGPEKIYISRSRATTRTLDNEVLVEDLFNSRGFDIVHPETLTVREQVNLFRNATWLAGCSGSNLFNCAFSKPTQRKFILTSRNYILHTDLLMNVASAHPITYYIGEPKTERHVHSSWHVDLTVLEDAVENWLQ